MDDFEIQGQDHYKDLDAENRLAFVRKVYVLLSLQLAVTTLITALAVIVDAFQDWMEDNLWFLVICIVLSFVVLIPVVCCRSVARKVPANYILAGIFTLCESFLVANFTALYDPLTILIAVTMTLGVTIAVSVYALTTKRDFTTWYGIMFGVLVGGIIFAFFMGFLYESRALDIVICLIFIIIYTIYIVIDTQAIAGGKRYSLSYDDYILGALALYIDIIGLFVYILALIGGKK